MHPLLNRLNNELFKPADEAIAQSVLVGLTAPLALAVLGINDGLPKIVLTRSFKFSVLLQMGTAFTKLAANISLNPENLADVYEQNGFLYTNDMLTIIVSTIITIDKLLENQMCALFAPAGHACHAATLDTAMRQFATNILLISDLNSTIKTIAYLANTAPAKTAISYVGLFATSVRNKLQAGYRQLAGAEEEPAAAPRHN